MKPPIRGPRTGPFINPRAQQLKVNSLCLSVETSLMVPGEFETTEHPTMAAKKRHTRTTDTSFVMAQGKMKNMNANSVEM